MSKALRIKQQVTAQDAPELNEENFPSLSNSTTASPLPKGQKGGLGGFASAVKMPAASLASPKAATPQNGHRAAAPSHGTDSSQISWKETGSASC